MNEDLKQICETYFGIIEDVRCEVNIKYKLTDILIIVMCGVLCGLDEIEKIKEYADLKEDMFREKFGIEKIPSETTIARVLATIDVEKLGIAILGILTRNVTKREGQISIDGKTIRSTETMQKYGTSLQILTAYLTDCGVCLEQIGIYEKTNEIPVAREILDLLDVKGKVVTLDAMHCQKDTVKKIIENHGDYIIGLKKNQHQLYKDIDEMYRDLLNSSYKEDKNIYDEYEVIEKNRGRIETRRIYNFKDMNWLEQKKDWEGMKTVFAVERTIEENDKTSVELSYYITSLGNELKDLLERTREHWKIESMHWLLDMTYSEDTNRTANEMAQKNLNVLRKLGLSVHKQYLKNINEKKPNIRKNMFKCMLNDELLFEVIANITNL